MKKRLIGTLLGFLALFGFGAIYYGILTADSAAAMAAANASCMLEAPNMAYILFGNVMMAYLLVYAFDKMGVNDAKSGAYQGAMIFAIVWAFVTVDQRAPQLFEAVAEKSEERLEDFKEQDLANID